MSENQKRNDPVSIRPQVLVITGPIGAGKSSVAAQVGARLRTAGRATAVLDLDEVVIAIGGFATLTMERFHQARRVHGELVAAWLRQGLDVVAHGPVFKAEHLDSLVHTVPPETAVRVALLQASFEVTAERVRNDPTRPTPFRADFLRAAYDRAQAALSDMPPCDWVIDTGTKALSETADELTRALLGHEAMELEAEPEVTRSAGSPDGPRK